MNLEDTSLKRLDRIVALLIQLQSKRTVKAQELAERFQVSLRTIYRDIRTLETAGVPLVGEAGLGYSIMEGYRLPPVMFSREEASSFVAAEKLMQQFTDESLGAYHQAAMFKIKSVLRGNEKDWVNILENQVKITNHRSLFNKEVPNAMEKLFEGVASKKQIYVEYLSVQAEAPSHRHIEVVGIFHENQNWYVLAYCHLRMAYRQFRTDRILKIKVTDLDFEREHASLEEHLKRKEPQKKIEVSIKVDKKVAPLLKHDKMYYGWVSETLEKNHVVMHFEVVDIQNGFARWYLMFGDYAQIIAPQALKDRVRELLERNISRLI